MDCLEFRRLLGSDPRVADSAARAHLETCPRCQDAYTRAQAFEARLAHALTVAVPEGFADRVLLAQLTGERQRPAHRFRYGWIALAAAAALVVAVGVVRRQGAAGGSLPDLVVAHVEGEERPAPKEPTVIEPASDDAAEIANEEHSMAKTPEEILAAEAAAAGGAEEVEDFSTEDIIAAEDALSESDANDAADAREEGIELDNDTMDTLVAESQEISDETIDSDGHDRG